MSAAKNRVESVRRMSLMESMVEKSRNDSVLVDEPGPLCFTVDHYNSKSYLCWDRSGLELT